MKSICEYLDEDYIKWGQNPYISSWDGQNLKVHNFQETIDDVKIIAKGLLERDLTGKNIMIFADNSYEWMVLDLAIMGYVGTCVPIDKEWTAYDIGHTLYSIEVGACFYSANKKSRIEELKECFPKLNCICIEEVWNELKAAGSVSNTELFGQKDLSRTAMILFTSGTTDIAKAIPLTQANLFNNWDTLFVRTPMVETDISYVFLPLNHVYSGVANFLYTIISGMKIVLCSDIRKVLPEMMQVRPTVVCMVPLILKRIYEAMMAMDDKGREPILQMLRGIRFLYCGGSFTDLHIKKYFVEQGVALIEAYGTTETSSVIALDKLGDPNIESNGVVFENLDVKIINPDKEGVGEIIVKGGSVSSGYLNQSKNRNEFDADGYYHTGDLARMDEERHLYLKGRKKRMIITANGKNVYVDELEQLILQNTDIKKVVVYEEDFHICATIVSNLSEQQIYEYMESVNEKLPGFKKIKKYYLKEDVLGGRIK